MNAHMFIFDYFHTSADYAVIGKTSRIKYANMNTQSREIHAIRFNRGQWGEYSKQQKARLARIIHFIPRWIKRMVRVPKCGCFWRLRLHLKQGHDWLLRWLEQAAAALQRPAKCWHSCHHNKGRSSRAHQVATSIWLVPVSNEAATARNSRILGHEPFSSSILE